MSIRNDGDFHSKTELVTIKQSGCYNRLNKYELNFMFVTRVKAVIQRDYRVYEAKYMIHRFMKENG